jgi:hypothetical protein
LSFIIIADLASKGNMMHKSRMLRTRDIDVMEDYCKLMIHIAPSIVPHREWDMVKEGRDNFSDIVTSTDEAHALLVIENNWNRFKFGEGLEGSDRERCRDTVWISEEEQLKYGLEEPRYTRTDGGRARNGRQGESGWSQDGLDRFNQLVGLVRKGRAATGHAFDAAVKKQCREMAKDNLGKRKRKRDRSGEDEEAINRLEQFQVACDFEFEKL